jgi:hypothetical protein
MYLASKYIWTIAGTVAVVLAKIVLDKLFVPTLGTTFAAVSTTVLLTLYAVMAFIVLRGIVGNYLSKSVLVGIAKVLISGAAALAVYFVLKLVIPGILTSRGVAFVIPIIACGVVYIAAVVALGLHKMLLKNPKKKITE